MLLFVCLGILEFSPRYLQATKENEQSIVNASFHVTQVAAVFIIICVVIVVLIIAIVIDIAIVIVILKVVNTAAELIFGATAAVA